jgi:hypothetical protein
MLILTAAIIIKHSASLKYHTKECLKKKNQVQNSDFPYWPAPKILIVPTIHNIGFHNKT